MMKRNTNMNKKKKRLLLINDFLKCYQYTVCFFGFPQFCYTHRIKSFESKVSAL